MTAVVLVTASPLPVRASRRAMQELLTAARARQPGVNYPLTAQMATPLVRVRLELQPDSARPEERRGVMRVMVRAVVLDRDAAVGGAAWGGRPLGRRHSPHSRGLARRR